MAGDATAQHATELAYASEVAHASTGAPARPGGLAAAEPPPAARPYAPPDVGLGVAPIGRPQDDYLLAQVPLVARERRGAFRGRSGFTWRERDWRASAWAHRLQMLRGLAALIGLLAVATAFAFVLATRAANTARSSQQPLATAAPQGVLVQPVQGSTTPTPALPPYLVGVWVDNPTPGGGGTEHVFVRVSHNVAAVVGAQVYLSVQFASGTQPYGPVATGKDGVATFNVNYGFAPRGQPVFVTATTTEGGQTLSAQTTFFPAG